MLIIAMLDHDMLLLLLRSLIKNTHGSQIGRDPYIALLCLPFVS